MLNHVEPGVTKIYDRYGYDVEKRKALETLERVLRRIIGDKPAAIVVPIA